MENRETGKLQKQMQDEGSITNGMQRLQNLQRQGKMAYSWLQKKGIDLKDTTRDGGQGSQGNEEPNAEIESDSSSGATLIIELEPENLHDDEIFIVLNQLFQKIQIPSLFTTRTNYTNPNSPPPQMFPCHKIIHHSNSFIPTNLFGSSSSQHQGQGVISLLGPSGFILIRPSMSSMVFNATRSLT